MSGSSVTRAKHRGASARRGAGAVAVRALLVVAACLAVVAAALIYVGYGQRASSVLLSVARFFYHPLAAVLLVALALEFIILKGADRTRLLQLELDKLRAKRRSELTMLRKTREGLERLKASGQSGDLDPNALSEQTDKLLKGLRPPETRLLGNDRKTEAS